MMAETHTANENVCAKRTKLSLRDHTWLCPEKGTIDFLIYVNFCNIHATSTLHYTGSVQMKMSCSAGQLLEMIVSLNMCWREALECNWRVHFARQGLSIQWHVACIMLFIQCGSWLKVPRCQFPSVTKCSMVRKSGEKDAHVVQGMVAGAIDCTLEMPAQPKSLWLCLYSPMLSLWFWSVLYTLFSFIFKLMPHCQYVCDFTYVVINGFELPTCAHFPSVPAKSQEPWHNQDPNAVIVEFLLWALKGATI